MGVDGAVGAESTAPGDGEAASRRQLTRRSVLGAGALIGAAGAASAATPSVLHDLLAVAGIAGAPAPSLKKPSLTLHVEREADLLLLDFEFYEFKVITSTKPHAIKALTARNYVVVTFPPQAIGEAVYPYVSGGSNKPGSLPTDPAPVLSTMAGPSHLTFTFPKGHTIPLHTMSAVDLLDWQGWPLYVAGGASTTSTQKTPAAPNKFATSIEAPYGLYLSPVVDHRAGAAQQGFTTTFRNPTEPLKRGAVTSLWSSTLTGTLHSVLHGKVTSTPSTPPVAAIWARDHNGPDATPENEIKFL